MREITAAHRCGPINRGNDHRQIDGGEQLRRITVVFDKLADLFCSNEVQISFVFVAHLFNHLHEASSLCENVDEFHTHMQAVLLWPARPSLAVPIVCGNKRLALSAARSVRLVFDLLKQPRLLFFKTIKTNLIF